MRVSFLTSGNPLATRFTPTEFGGSLVKRIGAFLMVVIGALVGSSAAFASALTSGHSASGGPGPGTFKPPTTGAGTHLGSQASGTGTLPFTGLNLTTFVVLAVLLIACGLVLRRMTHRRQ